MRFPIPPLSAAVALALVFCAGCAAPRKVTDERSNPAPEGYVAPVDSFQELGAGMLGAPLSAFPQMTLVEKLGAWETYTNPRENLKFGNIQLNEISYNFFEGRLYSIQVEVLEEKPTTRLVKFTNKTFGPHYSVEVKSYGDKLNRLVIREWTGNRIDVVFKFAEDFEGGTLIFVDKKMWLALEKPRRESIQRTMRSMDGSWVDLDFD